MRRNAPSLVDPKNTVTGRTDRQLGIVAPVSIEERLADLERQMASQNQIITHLLGMAGQGAQINYASPLVLTTFNVKGSVTTTNVTATSPNGDTITNSNLGPLVVGMPYLIVAVSGMALNAPASQSIIACVRIQASGTTTAGTRTTTASGERWGMAVDFKTVVGAGSSINIAGRARVTGGTGTVNDAFSFGIAIPLGGMVEV